MHMYTPECYCVIEILAEKADRDLLQGPEVPTSYKVFIDYNIILLLLNDHYNNLPLWTNNFV